jgi:hypothetical protein
MRPITRHRGLTIAGAAALCVATTALLGPAAHASSEVDRPERFTSAYTAWADAAQVADGGPGEKGATGNFMFWINSDLEVICYDIVLEGVTGNYQSPAATHLHQAASGEAGLPRIAFRNPDPAGEGTRSSSGCMKGPFVTGVLDDEGNVQSEDFSLARIEADPTAFFVDAHTRQHPDGVVRGQLTQVPLDGVDAGGGGTARQDGSLPLAGAGAAAGVLGLAAFVRFRGSRGKA